MKNKFYTKEVKLKVVEIGIASDLAKEVMKKLNIKSKFQV